MEKTASNKTYSSVANWNWSALISNDWHWEVFCINAWILISIDWHWALIVGVLIKFTFLLNCHILNWVWLLGHISIEMNTHHLWERVSLLNATFSVLQIRSDQSTTHSQYTSFDQNCLKTVSGQTLFSSLNDVVIFHHFKVGVLFLFLNSNVGLNFSNATTCQ